MRYPMDGTGLFEADRQCIKIDYCSTCKGAWLDRRELDLTDPARNVAQRTLSSLLHHV